MLQFRTGTCNLNCDFINLWQHSVDNMQFDCIFSAPANTCFAEVWDSISTFYTIPRTWGGF